jgi:hypothetical protein
MRYEGYWDIEKLPIKAGDIVLIRKGTRYHSMRDGEYHTAGKSYTVTVNHVLCGCEPGTYHERENPKVSWVGSGKYWHRADINDVEKVDTKETFYSFKKEK